MSVPKVERIRICGSIILTSQVNLQILGVDGAINLLVSPFCYAILFPPFPTNPALSSLSSLSRIIKPPSIPQPQIRLHSTRLRTK